MLLPAEDAANPTWWDQFWTFIATIIDWEIIGSIVATVIVTIIIRWVLLVIIRRTVKQIVSGAKTKSHIEKTSQILVSPLAQARVIQRTRTVGTVLENITTWTLVFIAGGTILALLNFNVGTIIASAGIIGAAIAFGAQNIIKDLLSGLFMVFEDQLGVGDFVDVGSASGMVEGVGIRVTRVRDVEGTLWYVRNGEIVRVGNRSQGWGRAVVTVTVPSNQSVGTVERVLKEAAAEVVNSPSWQDKVLGTPEVWALDELSGVGMVFKLAVKTKPAQQGDVSQVLRRHIHDRFADAGIPLITNEGVTVSLTRQAPPADKPAAANQPSTSTGSTKLRTQSTPVPTSGKKPTTTILSDNDSSSTRDAVPPENRSRP